MITKIVIPNWLRKERPVTAGFCEMINEALASNPRMSLEEFAQAISEANVSDTIKRLEKAEETQFNGEKI